MEIVLDIMGNPKLLKDCLDRYFLKELLDGNHMYSCDRCADFVEAHKFLSIKHAPNILVITLKRVEVTCSRCKGTSSKEDNIMEILLDIMGNPKLLKDCLDCYFLKELLDGNNMYSCDRCADFVEAHKFLSIKHAPNILVITLKRVEYTCDSLCGKSCCQKNGSERKNISLSVLEHKHNRISDLPEYNYIRYDGGKFYPTGIKGNYDSIGEGLGKGYNINVPLTRVSGQDSDYSAIWDSILIPVAEIFDPEIILVSAGFDAVKGDIGEFNLTPSIFAHLLRKLMRFANGRILLALEGGYGLKTLPKALVGCFRCLLGDDIEVNVRKSIAKETKAGIQQALLSLTSVLVYIALVGLLVLPYPFIFNGPAVVKLLQQLQLLRNQFSDIIPYSGRLLQVTSSFGLLNSVGEFKVPNSIFQMMSFQWSYYIMLQIALVFALQIRGYLCAVFLCSCCSY